jgi:hypothetical protein
MFCPNVKINSFSTGGTIREQLGKEYKERIPNENKDINQYISILSLFPLPTLARNFFSSIVGRNHLLFSRVGDAGKRGKELPDRSRKPNKNIEILSILILPHSFPLVGERMGNNPPKQGSTA